MHMLLILLALCLRKSDGISHLFSIAYAFAGNGCFSGNPALGLVCNGPPTCWGHTPSSSGTDRRLLRSGSRLVCDHRIVLYAGSLPDGVHRFRVQWTGDPSPFGPAVC